MIILNGGNRHQDSQDFKPLTDSDVMPFGAHKDKRLEDVPASYLLWLWDDGWHNRTSEPLGAYIKSSFTALVKECPDFIIKNKP